jgi:uncharacterized membrane protein YeaQ/YmgE (transglycosylase-associated protein family)
MSVISWILLGLVAGILARALLPGAQSTGILLTTLLGILGALVGGFIGRAFGLGTIHRFFDLGTWLLAIAGAVVVFAAFDLLTRRRRRQHWRL